MVELTDIAGVGPVTAKKLEAAGITKITHILSRGIPDLADITGMDSSSCESLYQKALDTLRKNELIMKRFMTGSEVAKMEKEVLLVSTGSEALDDFLGGGVRSQHTTEVYGEFGCGKTQFCNTLAVRVQLPVEKGGLSTENNKAKCLWIDTEGTFRSDRITTIALKNDLDPNDVLDNIIYTKPYNSSDLFKIVEESENIIVEKNIKMIIVDSATGLFRSDYIGRGLLSDRQGKINRFITRISRMADIYNIPVILTNQVMQAAGQLFGDPTKPIGGSVFGHGTTYRIYFKKSGENRIAEMVDSPEHDRIQVPFALNDRGVTDIEQRDKDKKESKKKKIEEE